MHDREVVIEAIRQNGGAHWSVSEELKHDREVVIEEDQSTLLSTAEDPFFLSLIHI